MREKIKLGKAGSRRARRIGIIALGRKYIVTRKSGAIVGIKPEPLQYMGIRQIYYYIYNNIYR